MPRIALLAAMALIALSSADTGQAIVTARGNPAHWRFASGRAPTRAEYVAVVAACQDGAVVHMRHRPLDACLANLGLHRQR